MNTNSIKNAVRLLRSVADELEMCLPAMDSTIMGGPNANACMCDHWDFNLKQCGIYKQVPPKHVLEESWKYCPNTTDIPF